jgi:hypothetical protein
MHLNAFVAEKRTRVFDDLTRGLLPSEGEYSEELLKEGRIKGQAQMGTTRFEPTQVVLEFIFPDPRSSATILSVHIATPERILFMPVPSWVVESIWQGEIDGSYRFESEAAELLAEYAKGLDAEANGKWFGPRQAMPRE